MSVPNPLRKFTTDELLAEIVRRRNAIERDNSRIKNWCDDCGNFRCWTESYEPPENYNACGKGHVMKFACPPLGGDPHGPAGFYRTVCPDRIPIPPPVPSAPIGVRTPKRMLRS